MLKKIYHPYYKWEDYKNGMYKLKIKNMETKIGLSLSLLSSPDDLYKSMMGVTIEWIYSTEHNLTDVSINRQAWLGQAACCYNHKAPEYITRISWGLLNEKKKNYCK